MCDKSKLNILFGIITAGLLTAGENVVRHATTRFLRKGGAKAPPLFFEGGAFFRKGGGAKFFSSVHCCKN